MQGTYRKDRVLPAAAEPQRLAQVPDPPEGLSSAAQVEWLVVAGWLQEIGQLATTDVTLLAAYCNEVASYWEYDRRVKTEGSVVEFRDRFGNLTRMAPHPYTTLRTSALSNSLKLAGQFGLTPVMRSRIAAGNRPKPQSKLDQLKNRK